jgi:hypothetical protein
MTSVTNDDMVDSSGNVSSQGAYSSVSTSTAGPGQENKVASTTASHYSPLEQHYTSLKTRAATLPPSTTLTSQLPRSMSNTIPKTVVTSNFIGRTSPVLGRDVRAIFGGRNKSAATYCKTSEDDMLPEDYLHPIVPAKIHCDQSRADYLHPVAPPTNQGSQRVGSFKTKAMLACQDSQSFRGCKKKTTPASLAKSRSEGKLGETSVSPMRQQL